MFHVADGLYFERIEEGEHFGGVRIIKRKSAYPDAPIVFEKVIDANGWASVVSSMTVLGESGATFAAVRALQTGG